MTPCCTLNITAACAAKDREIADLKQRLEQEPEDVQVAKAQRDEALDMVRRLVKRIDKHGGYSKPDQQADMRGARALLAEHGVAEGRRLA